VSATYSSQVRAVRVSLARNAARPRNTLILGRDVETSQRERREALLTRTAGVACVRGRNGELRRGLFVLMTRDESRQMDAVFVVGEGAVGAEGGGAAAHGDAEQSLAGRGDK